MALRTRSTSARAAIAASRIKRSETQRLQSAIKDMEAAIEKYNKDKEKRSNKKGLWNALGKLGGFITKAGAFIGNPLLGGAGLAISGVSGYAEGSLSKSQSEKAEQIRTDFTEPLSNLLFVGQDAKDVQKGAENLKSAEEQATDEQYASDLFRIGTGLAIQSVTAGQAGTFGKGTADFLNKPLIDLGEAPGEGADEMTKFLYNQRKNLTPSTGQLLGGVSPAQQQMGQNFMNNLQSASIAKSNQQSLDALSSLGSEGAPDLGFDMTNMVQETPMQMPNIDFRNNYDTIGTSDVFPQFSSTISNQNSIAPKTLPPYFGIGLDTVTVTPNQNQNINDAFASLRQTVNRYNQGGM